MIYTPLSIFKDDIKKAVIYLNHPTSLPGTLFTRLWKNAYPVAFVDGTNYFPHFLTGDFDSIQPEVLEFYRSANVAVIETPDQEETDFTKCVRIVINSIEQNNVELDVLVAVQMSGGRFDHEMGLIKTLYETKKLTNIPLLLVSECSVTFLLDEGEHTIRASTGYEGQHVGLIPVGQPCQVTTTGLQWNLDNGTLSFDDIVSTSNRLLDEIVHINCNRPLLFTMEYKNDMIN
ncbi:unnamed protein product [Schistosoma margrebowiei]|uniref:Thiamin pyrophosphokinase thiamin-binding domain-containing protein n=1 Tax=Schistosoma margrebowiei TaxID=48269 RepID=A0AA84ZZN5_9TREM|nr:unnamed protein product [Schistosoma margrebowiei]